MSVAEERRLLPENIQLRQDQLLNTLFGVPDDPSTPNVDESKTGLIDEKIDLSKGDIIIFPSNFMYPHKVEPVTKGTRYSYISWIW